MPLIIGIGLMITGTQGKAVGGPPPAHGPSIVEEDGVSYILQEDGTSSILTE